MKRIILSAIAAATAVYASAADKTFSAGLSSIAVDAPAGLPRKAPAAKQPSDFRPTAAGDFDFCYYWLQNTGVISNTWETSITEIVATDTPGKYLVKNLLADTFSTPTSKVTVDDIVAHYDPTAGIMTIDAGQHLFDTEQAGSTISISILGIVRGDKGWTFSTTGQLELISTPLGFQIADGSELDGFYIGHYDPDKKRYSGYGAAIFPDFYEFNGVMLYQVTPDEDTEPIAFLCDIYSFNRPDGLLEMRNFANFGYDVSIVMDYDTARSAAWADDAVLGKMTDTGGGSNPYYACDADASGNPLLYDGHHRLTASISTDGRGNSVLSNPQWGAFIGRQWLGMYSTTQIMLFRPLPDRSGVAMTEADDDSSAAVYYNLQGVRVATDRQNLPAGLYIKRQGGKSAKVIVR